MKKLLSLIVAGSLLVGVPAVASADVHVRGYYRNDGTYVPPHYRSNPDGINVRQLLNVKISLDNASGLFSMRNAKCVMRNENFSSRVTKLDVRRIMFRKHFGG